MVKFYRLVLKILSGNENLTSIKVHNNIMNNVNSVTYSQKMTGNNSKLGLVNNIAHTKLGQTVSISSQDIER